MMVVLRTGKWSDGKYEDQQKSALQLQGKPPSNETADTI
jgi:hypothetical protein